MSTIEAIEQAVERLGKNELADFRDWFTRYDADCWDAQIERDAATGKLDDLVSGALEDFDAGRVKEA
jgi:hypothetical protein